MMIGKLVKAHIPQIFAYCEAVDHEEIDSLLDKQYSKATFGTNFPFCAEVDSIESAQSKRYWTEIYLVRGRRVRVTSQWYDTSDPLFGSYLLAKRIAVEPEPQTPQAAKVVKKAPRIPASSLANSRYRGNAIGNAQNLFVRNVLSSIGTERFSERDWESTKKWFSHRCAYCGAEDDLVIEHAIPINKERLGEHRLGNLVPSCSACNKAKGASDFREFLGKNAEAVGKIEQYMDSRNYVPLEENVQVSMILNMAHKEVGALADRYITILNELFVQGASDEETGGPH